jgi:hypothetical protein
MLETGLLFSLFPDFQRVFGDRSPQKERNRQFFLSLFGLADQLMNGSSPVPEPILLTLFVTPFIQAITPDHPSLGEKERYLYRMQTIRWALHQILVPFSFPRGSRELAFQILLTQPSLERAIQRGGIPKRLRSKKYLKEAVYLYGMLAEARGERTPSILRNAVPWDLLPWWPKPPKRRHRRPGWRSVPQCGT